MNQQPHHIPSSRIDEEAGVPHSVAPGIWRIPLPVPLALRWVNVWVLQSGGETALIDCGFGIGSSREALESGLAVLGVRYTDLAALVLTHSHPDHIGLAGLIAEAMPPEAPVYMYRDEIDDMLDFWGRQTQEAFAPLGGHLVRAGTTAASAEDGVREFMMLAHIMQLPHRTRMTPVVDGQVLVLGGRAWEVIWTPGHADGHICLRSERLLLAADHILPGISPNVSYYPESRPNPMQDYLDALVKIERLALVDPLVLPGHGLPFTALAERIMELRQGHLERAKLVAATVTATPQTPMEITRQVFTHRTLRGPEERLALGETMAHLKRLEHAGMVQYEESDGRMWYYRGDSETP